MRKYFIILIVLCPLIIFSYPKKYLSDFNVYDQVAYLLSRDLTEAERAQIKGLIKEKRKELGRPLDNMDTSFIAQKVTNSIRYEDMEQSARNYRATYVEPLMNPRPELIAMREAIKRGEYYARDYHDLVETYGMTKEEFNRLNKNAPNPDSAWNGIISLLRIALPLLFVIGFPIIITIAIVIVVKTVGAGGKAAYKLGNAISKTHRR